MVGIIQISYNLEQIYMSIAFAISPEVGLLLAQMEDEFALEAVFDPRTRTVRLPYTNTFDEARIKIAINFVIIVCNNSLLSHNEIHLFAPITRINRNNFVCHQDHL